MRRNPDVKLEAMLLHLLHQKADNGKTWFAITIPGVARFTREDVEIRLKEARKCKRWWEFWK